MISSLQNLKRVSNPDALMIVTLRYLGSYIEAEIKSLDLNNIIQSIEIHFIAINPVVSM